jgi:hypothetical protein
MIEALIHRIKIRQAELQMSTAVGMPVTWEAYQRLVGEHQGLQSVLAMVDEMLDEAKEDKNN